MFFFTAFGRILGLFIRFLSFSVVSKLPNMSEQIVHCIHVTYLQDFKTDVIFITNLGSILFLMQKGFNVNVVLDLTEAFSILSCFGMILITELTLIPGSSLNSHYFENSLVDKL